MREYLKISCFGPHPLEKWMTIQDMGYVITNWINIIFIILRYLCHILFLMTTLHLHVIQLIALILTNKIMGSGKYILIFVNFFLNSTTLLREYSHYIIHLTKFSNIPCFQKFFVIGIKSPPIEWAKVYKLF